jgi:hypothetical protein
MAGRAPAMSRGMVPPLMAGTSPAMMGGRWVSDERPTRHFPLGLETL